MQTRHRFLIAMIALVVSALPLAAQNASWPVRGGGQTVDGWLSSAVGYDISAPTDPDFDTTIDPLWHDASLTMIARAPSGNVYVTGRFGIDDSDQQPSTFGVGDDQVTISPACEDEDDPYPNCQWSWDAFVAKYDATGRLLWVRRAGGVQDDGAHAIAIDDDENVFIVGSVYSGEAYFGPITANAAGRWGFVASLTSDGAWRWVKTISRPDQSQSRIDPTTIAVRPADPLAVPPTETEIFVGAIARCGARFDGDDTTYAAGSCSTGNNNSGFLAKLDDQGDLIDALSAPKLAGPQGGVLQIALDPEPGADTLYVITGEQSGGSTDFNGFKFDTQQLHAIDTTTMTSRLGPISIASNTATRWYDLEALDGRIWLGGMSPAGVSYFGESSPNAGAVVLKLRDDGSQFLGQWIRGTTGGQVRAVSLATNADDTVSVYAAGPYAADFSAPTDPPTTFASVTLDEADYTTQYGPEGDPVAPRIAFSGDRVFVGDQYRDVLDEFGDPWCSGAVLGVPFGVPFYPDDVVLAPADSENNYAFGSDISAEGGTIAIASDGGVFIFERNGTSQTWGVPDPYDPVASNENVSFSVSSAGSPPSIELVGDELFVGARGASTFGAGVGAVQIRSRDQGGPDAWGVSSTLGPTDPSVFSFGRLLRSDGETLVAISTQYVHVFERDVASPTGWSEVHTESLGSPVRALAVEGDLIAYTPFWGSVRVLRRTETGWAIEGFLWLPTELDQNNSLFGQALEIQDGTIAVGDPEVDQDVNEFDENGLVLLYQAGGGCGSAWCPSGVLSSSLDPSSDQLANFGAALGSDGDRLAILENEYEDVYIRGFEPAGGSFLARLGGSNGTWDWVSGSDGQSMSLTNGGSTVQVAGRFAFSADFGDDNVSSAGADDIFVAQADAATGEWFSFQTFVVGQEVPAPEGAAAGTLAPQVLINGLPDDALDYHFYSPPSAHAGTDGRGHLYLTQAAGSVEIRWPLSDDPLDPGYKLSLGAAIWPEIQCEPGGFPACRQPHVAGAPVEIESADPNLTFVRAINPIGNSSDANVTDGVFTAPRSGWSVLEYVSGDAPDTTQFPVSYVVVRTQAWDAHDNLDSAQPCTIGTALTDAAHDETGRTGWVVQETARYDGHGPDAAYQRAARGGSIVAVNRISPDRPQDVGRELVVAWYRDNGRGVWWPWKPIEYDCQWPAGPPQLVIGDGQGSGALDPAAYPAMQLYVQDDPALAGYNPNDEHAVLRPSADGSGTALFALRSDFGAAIGETAAASDPYVLLKHLDPGDPGSWVFTVYGVSALGPLADFRRGIDAGSIVEPLYPLNLLGGCTAEGQTSIVGELPDDLVPPPPFYRDNRGGLWARSASDPAAPGAVRFHYPLQPGFFVDLDNDDASDLPDGSCIPWLARLPVVDGGTADPLTPADTLFDVAWPSTPMLTIGETLLEPKRGLPDIVNQAAVQVVYDELQQSTLDGGSYDPRATLVRLIDPLGERSVPLASAEFDAAMLAWSQDGATRAIDGNLAGTRSIAPSLRARLRYDPLAVTCDPLDPSSCVTGRLTLTGLLDGSAAGEPLLLPNVLTDLERLALLRLDADGDENAQSGVDCVTSACDWDDAVQALFDRSRDPDELDLADPGSCTVDGGGVTPRVDCDGAPAWTPGVADGPLVGFADVDGDLVVDPARRLGAGGALTAGFARGQGYVTLAFNDDPSLGALPISLEVIRVGCLEYTDAQSQPAVSTYQGQLQVIEPDNLFDEQITLRHSGDFAGNADNVEFEWYYHPNTDGTPPQPLPDPEASQLNGWTKITLPSNPGFGYSEITIGGSDLPGLPPVQSLADNWYVARYRGLPECATTADWSLWAGQPGSTPTDQRAQLSEGWVKRVVDSLNPFDARVDAFHATPTNTLASMIAQLGERYEGPIALNADPQNLNQIGLIEAYETVMRRAMDLSVNAGLNYAPANDAILNIATRLVDFYVLLGNESLVDALDPTVGLGTDSSVGSLAPTIFTFENQAASLLEEELVLLRGRDDLQGPVAASPVYNRYFWNFTGGDGELAYALSYNISDQNGDGFLDETDARAQFPQGHGDAWGHYLTALQTHYRLLRHPSFTWQPRAEAVLVAGTPIQVDFLDERKFARAAAARARTGAQIVDLTYRDVYVEDVGGQWQGYEDTDAERAWGLSEWGRRAGQAAYLDWLAVNSTLPDRDPLATLSECDQNGNQPGCDPSPLHTGIEVIDRTTVGELDDIVAQYAVMQSTLDEADRGLNPLGLAKGVVPFDIDPSQVDAGKTHYEQIQERAEAAVANAVSVWDYANQLGRMLRQNQDSVGDLAQTASERERDYRSRLVEIFGSPYPDDIGPGGTYPDGYDGPDFYHYQYVDLAQLSGERLDEADLCGSGLPAACEDGVASQIQILSAAYTPFEEGGFLLETEPEECGDGSGDECTFSGASDGLSMAVPYTLWRSPDFGLVPVRPPSWTGRRAVTGRIQFAQQEVAREQLALKQSLVEYENLAAAAEDARTDLIDFLDVQEAELNIRNDARNEIQNFDTAIQSLRAVRAVTRRIGDIVLKGGQVAADCLPKVNGVSNDVTSGVRCGLKASTVKAAKISTAVADAADWTIGLLGALQNDVSRQETIQLEALAGQTEANRLAAAITSLLREEPVLRAEMFQRAQALQQAEERLRNAQAEGARLLDELVAFRKQTAAATQQYRYRDLAFRLFGNDALQKYRAAFDLAARYSYLAATAYDYDTNLLGPNAQSGQSFLTDIVRERSLGQVIGGQAVAGSSGLADPLARMEQNFGVLKGQMGFNNPQVEGNRFSLRREHFGIRDEGPAGDAAWRETLAQYRVDDLWRVPEFRRLAKPFTPESAGPQPGLVIPLDSTVTFGLNFFGEPLGAGDSAYDPANFSTRIRAAGLWLDGYDALPLSNTPRVYLIPAGADVLRAAQADNFETRQWTVVDQLLPIPFPIGETDLADPAWIPESDSLSDAFGQNRRMSSFRAFPFSEPLDTSEFTTDSRLIGRSVWNSRWVLIVPGGTLLNDPTDGLDTLIEGNELPDGSGDRDGAGIDDILVYFQTYAYSGL